MTTVAFDLDGTLVTAGPRQSWLLCAAALAHDVRLDANAVWDAKREGASNWDYLQRQGVDDAVVARICALWGAQIETPYWLLMDTLVPTAAATLDALNANGHRCILVTARANACLMRQQIRRLGLLRQFASVHCVSPVCAAQEKENVLREQNVAFFVGDAESDAAAAHAAGVPFAGVATGQRSRRFLLQHGVRQVFDNLADSVATGLAGTLG
jgi:phosphoglycolate phosphatase-like HAD superfamily hydrolase